MWERHIINCAVVKQAIPEGATVIDVGSGAGLPGIPLAIARPDLQITLIEPLLKRYNYLNEVVEELGLDNVTVLRGRAEEGPIKRLWRAQTWSPPAPSHRWASWRNGRCRSYARVVR